MNKLKKGDLVCLTIPAQGYDPTNIGIVLDFKYEQERDSLNPGSGSGKVRARLQL